MLASLNHLLWLAKELIYSFYCACMLCIEYPAAVRIRAAALPQQLCMGPWGRLRLVRGNSPCAEVHADQNSSEVMYRSCADGIPEDFGTDMAAAAQAPTSYSPSPMYTPSPTPKPTPKATQQQQQQQPNNNQNNNMNMNMNNNSEFSAPLLSFSTAPCTALLGMMPTHHCKPLQSHFPGRKLHGSNF